jgi:hypothetical protein
MSEEDKKELQQSAGGNTSTEQSKEQQDPTEEKTPKVTENTPVQVVATESASTAESEMESETKQTAKDLSGNEPEVKEATTQPAEAPDTPGEVVEARAEKSAQKEPEAEIDEDNAEDAEDAENQRRHHIPFLDYHSLSLENLVGELQRLVRTEKIQAIRRHADAIKSEFDQKFQEFLEHKKEEFIARGGNEVDFRYNSVTKRQFNELYREYREKRNQYYKDLEKNLKENLQQRLAIIEELKGLVNVEEDMTTTYNSFKELQERWRHAGPVPRTHYNDVWRTYQHHVEIFYDFLHLNRELRDLDFKHNLDEKLKLIKRAEALAEEPDVNTAFRELQTLHKLWKEEVGPVAKENREAIWERFSAATKAIHQRRQEHQQELDQRYEENLVHKQELIAKISAVADTVANNHKELQKQIREIESLREKFFQAGKVPQKENENTWAAFKEAVRRFNRAKNAFYKNLKKEQQINLDKKKALLQRAEELKDSEEWDTVTPEMKQIQKEWKSIGHVPRKYSDKIWKQFKAACNHYFDRLHAQRNSASADQRQNLEQKEALLAALRDFQLSGKRDSDLKQIQEFLAKSKAIGHLPRNKRHLNSKFQKIIDALLRKLGVSKQEADLLRYGDKIKQLSKRDDASAIEQERQFIRKKIEENKGQLRQLENNLEFFTDPSEDNPLVREVLESIERQKEALDGWNAKLKKLNIMRNSLEREPESRQEEE